MSAMMKELNENELNDVNGGLDPNDLIRSMTVEWEDENGNKYSYTLQNKKKEPREIKITHTVEWEDQGGNRYSSTYGE